LVAFSRKEYPEYHSYLDAVFGSLQAKVRIAEEHDSASSLIAALESGAGVSVVTRSFGCSAGSRLKLVPLSPEPAPLVIGCVWSKDGLTPAAERFWQTAQGVVSTLK
jgi:DNA-binding transcriptional LysR family regulator